MKNNTEKAYDEVFKMLEKHKDVCVFDLEDLKRKSSCHIFGVKLRDEYGLNIDPKNIDSTSFNKFFDYIRLYSVGENFNNRISWSDDGSQPDNELLLSICFPTGAYIFGEDYATEFFQRFFNELKTYNPKYTDTTNKTLYFAMDNAKEVFNNFKELLKKYYELNKEDAKLRKIEKMRKDLEKLEAN